MGYFQDDVEDAFGYKWGKAILGFIVVLGIYLAAAFFWNIWPFSVASGLAKKVVNPTSIVYNYEWYYDQYNSILAQEANIEVINPEAPERAGMIMILNRNISEYNSKSRQITRNLWKADDLPQTIQLYKE